MTEGGGRAAPQNDRGGGKPRLRMTGENNPRLQMTEGEEGRATEWRLSARCHSAPPTLVILSPHCHSVPPIVILSEAKNLFSCLKDMA